MRQFLTHNMILVVVAAILFVINCLLFYPGYYSNDSIQQLSQALPGAPITDWHPPVMVVVWKVLLAVTEKPASMLAFQLLLFWTAAGILSIVVYRLTKNKLISFAPIVMGLLPMTIGISGVIWKDVQMAYALVLATALMLLIASYQQLRRNALWKWIIISVATLLILYAGLLRYNALIAVVPLLYLVIDSLGIFKSWKLKLLIALGLIIIATGASAVGNKILNVIKMNPTSSVMLDDIINIRTREEITHNQGELYETLAAVQHSCGIKDIPINSYWNCTDEGQRNSIRQTQYDELKRYWVQTIITNPFGYALYRAETFTIFTFAPNQYVFWYHEGIVPNELGQKVRYDKAQNILHIYVMEFGYQHFSYLFQAWFWIIAGLVTLWIGIKKLKKYKQEVIVLSTSSLIYIFSYIPVVVAADYRYIYWSVFATLIAVLLIVIEKPPLTRMKKSK